MEGGREGEGEAKVGKEREVEIGREKERGGWREKEGGREGGKEEERQTERRREKEERVGWIKLLPLLIQCKRKLTVIPKHSLCSYLTSGPSNVV